MKSTGTLHELSRMLLRASKLVCAALISLHVFNAPAAAADSPPVLPQAVRAVLELRKIPADSVSIQVDNLTSDETVLSWQADVARNPASVMKLLTTLVALDTLGPTYTWKTEAYLLGELRDGTLHGDLLLKGYGDPYLVTERMWRLQRGLRALGLTRIEGDLLIDDSWFNVEDYDPGAFDNEPLRAYNVAPNALMTNYKVLRYRFEPAGKKVSISVEPPLQNVEIVNRLTVRPGACRGYRRGIAINASEGHDRITFSGRFPSGCKYYTLDRSALSHNAYTYGLFRSLWTEYGGSLTGGWKNALAPEDTAPDFVFDSLPLADVVSKVNKHSNNVMSRQLLYTLAAETYGPPGTEENGRAVIAGWLAKQNMNFPELMLANGAGLSREARMTADHMAALLRYAYKSRIMPEYLASLPLSGLDGTLSRRFRTAGLSGIAHMKTGSLDHVSSIAGYVLGRSGDRYSVVVLINHDNVHRGTGDEVQEALLNWVREQ